MSTILRTLAAAIVLAASQASAATGDWPQYGFTADGRRHNTQETILDKKTVAQLTPKWSANTPVGTSSAAVANGIVYVGSTDKHLYAFDAKSGALVWQAATGGFVMSSPAVADGVVYVGSNDGRIYAFDAETGSLRWSAHTGYNAVQAPVTVAGGLVYAGTTDGNMFALSAKTGAVKWTKTFVFGGETLAPAVAHGIVYFTNDMGGELDALDARTGASLWMQRPGGFAALAVGDGVIYGKFSNAFGAFDAKTGAERWWITAGGDGGAIAIGKSHLYSASGTASLMDIDRANGAVKYDIYTQQPVFAAPALANGVLYFGSMAGNCAVSAYDTGNGKLLWSAATGRINAAPTVSNGMLYVGSVSKFTAYGLP
jgi:outer membrane protein assembly factor BamB